MFSHSEFTLTETFTFTVNGKTVKVDGRENLTPEQLAVIEASDKSRQSIERMADALRKVRTSDQPPRDPAGKNPDLSRAAEDKVKGED